MREGGGAQGAEANQENKRRPWMRLEVSGGGILVVGGVIIAAALAARRRSHDVNKERNNRKTTAGSDYEQYHKEKEEEVKDGSSIINGYGEITVADDLVKIKKAGSMTEVDEKLCLCQSYTEEREEWKKEAETVVGLKAYERVEKQDDRQQVGEEKVSACAVDEKKKEKEDDACNGVGEGEGDQVTVNGHGQEEDQLSDEMLFVRACNQVVIHVEDDNKLVDEEEQMEANTRLGVSDEVLERKESCGEETEPVVEELGKGEEGFQPNETNEEEGELSSSTNVVLKDEVEEGECDCREKGCNFKEEEPTTESYQDKTEPLAEKGEVQSNETNAKEGGLFLTNAMTKNKEPDAEPVSNIEEEEEGECNQKGEEQATESYEEETEPLVKEDLLHREPAVNTEEVQEDEWDAKEEPATESCEEETGSSENYGASSTENEDAVWPAEVLEHDETKAGQLATTMQNRQIMMMMTMEKKKGKAFFIYVNHSLLVLAIALALALLSFHLSNLTVY
ncbi:hypothetical protein IHE45_19G181100 [Dioscorea alata]|uniref:Uncharacterized protein n=1 Tax=Dioscorea alata TaxID=55571 RepID=A0ACB7U3Z7_DIOAL|nr:hypothetical protein IHE45_19G181100 [Dioscorea alata]